MGDEDETRDREDTRALDAAEVQELAARMRADQERKAALAAHELPPDLEELAAEPTRVEDPEEERRAALAEIEARHRAELERERAREAQAGPSDIEALRRRVAQGRAERAAQLEAERASAVPLPAMPLPAEHASPPPPATGSAEQPLPMAPPTEHSAPLSGAMALAAHASVPNPVRSAPRPTPRWAWVGLAVLSLCIAGWAFWMTYRH